MTESYIYRLFLPEDWQGFQQAGQFHGHADDKRDGFIHFSNAVQLRETAARHYSGHSALVLAEMAVSAFGDELKWEASRGGDLFPHLYAVLSMDAVTRVWDLKLDGKDTYDFPDFIP